MNPPEVSAVIRADWFDISPADNEVGVIPLPLADHIWNVLSALKVIPAASGTVRIGTGNVIGIPAYVAEYAWPPNAITVDAIPEPFSLT